MTWSQNPEERRGERPVGVPAAHGHWGDGGADIRGTLESPEHDSVCQWGVGTSIGRSAQFRPVRRYSKAGSWEFRCTRQAKAKGLTQSGQKKGGEKFENGRGNYRCDAKLAEKTLRFAAGRILGRAALQGAGIEWGGARW